MRQLENAVRTGQSVLLEDVGETLDPGLEPLLLKEITRQAGRSMIKLGDALVEYDRDFKLFMTTKLQNPHYLPEVCIKVTLINFAVTKVGLEGQLLSDVVKLERPDLEQQRTSLVVNISNDRKQLKEAEDKTLKLLFNAKGNILDDEELIDTLNQSKITSTAINIRLVESVKTEIAINEAREKYLPVAIRGSVLFFVIADLSEIDSMYQFSLNYFKSLVSKTISCSEKSDDLEQRILILRNNITIATFSNVSRGIFAAHKLIFPFLMCVEILRDQNLISATEWSLFLRGGVANRKDLPPQPTIRWLTATMWANLYDLSLNVPKFAYVVHHIAKYSDQWESIMEAESPLMMSIPGDKSGTITQFQKLMLIKIMREEKLVHCSNDFVSQSLGPEFIVVPPLDLEAAFVDTTCASPLIFILTPGSDPVSSIIKHAASVKPSMSDKLQIISLGQGQGQIAEILMRKAAKEGGWIFLQNCHLAGSWMPKLEFLIKALGGGELDPDPKFRVILSSMPSKLFPISILQEGIKVTNEPPKGLRANLARSFADISQDKFDEHTPYSSKFRKLVYGLCFFNAIIHERKKFGPLGWNTLYDFSNTDLNVSIIVLKNILEEYKAIPWDALTYLTADITFGGRVTDDWDRRTLKSTLSRFYLPAILESGYAFSPSGIYVSPPDGDLESFRNYIALLPNSEEPSVFGMHSNADISYQLQESRRLIQIVLDVQPRQSGVEGGSASETIALEACENILLNWPDLILLESEDKVSGSEFSRSTQSKLFECDESGRPINALSVVLMQEVNRFNKLNCFVKKSLDNMTKALKGQIVMSNELELVYRSIIINQVPFCLN